jgi:hypothetical protein
MYVKIVKINENHWYDENIFLGSIFEVEHILNRYNGYYLKYNNTDCWIEKQDCEIIDINNDQISEEFARKLLKACSTHNHNIEIYISEWKQIGYIKQSREDEIKDLIEYHIKVEGSDKTLIQLQQELIEILDKKIKED